MNIKTVGIVGAGYISAAYLKSSFPQFKIVACADVIPENANLRAKEFGLEPLTVDALLADGSIDVVLNLTTPQNHAAISQAALESGKHVYSEKPFALSREEAHPLLESAESKQLRIGSAPDTFLGGSHQTVRKLVDDGAIGRPIGGAAFFMYGGPESWHPNPEFLYQKGAGPVLDMGPYYVTALVNLLGPVKNVLAFGSNARPKRTIGSGPRQGTEFAIEVLTYVTAILEFESGAAVTLTVSFDVAGHNHAPIEIYGTEGSIQVPDPNYFGGNVRLIRTGGRWTDIAPTHCFADANYRGIGLADMSAAIVSGKPHRASGQLAYHVLEVLQAILSKAEGDTSFEIRSTCERPLSLPAFRQVADFSTADNR
ncbi:MAG: Gfo/Idh/MocA family oxidoreductase [Verrucomicrobia bacterium]|nr:Gfo/Idh/MocA family oxidoreductase [Verrucomicrobiota bacterium]